MCGSTFLISPYEREAIRNMALTTDNRPPGSRPVHPAPRKDMPWPLRFYRSAVGKKWVMGLTGLMLLGFVISHALGNVKMYISPESINEYGEALRDLGGHLVPRTNILWLMRFGLIGAFALHIHAAWSLTVMNRRSRPTKYQSKRDYVATDFAGRSMRWTGTIVLLFIFWHLADLTWGFTMAEGHDGFVRGEVYDNLVNSLSRVPVAIIYIVANLALANHLYHGVASMFQTLGINNPRINGIRQPIAISVAALVAVLNISFPLAIQFGIVA